MPGSLNFLILPNPMESRRKRCGGGGGGSGGTNQIYSQQYRTQHVIVHI